MYLSYFLAKDHRPYFCLLDEYDLVDTQWPLLSTFLTTSNGQVIKKAEGLCEPCLSRHASN